MKSFVLSALVAALACPLMSQPTAVPVEEEPRHHVVLKNNWILVMHVTVPAGDSTLYHIHLHDRIAIGLSNSTIAQQELNQSEGPPAPSEPGRISARHEDKTYTHRVHNVGSTPFEVLDVEILQRPAHPTANPAAPIAAENPSARAYKYVLAPRGILPDAHSRASLPDCCGHCHATQDDRPGRQICRA